MQVVHVTALYAIMHTSLKRVTAQSSAHASCTVDSSCGVRNAESAQVQKSNIHIQPHERCTCKSVMLSLDAVVIVCVLRIDAVVSVCVLRIDIYVYCMHCCSRNT